MNFGFLDAGSTVEARYYELLGVDPSKPLSADELKRAFRQAAVQHHPDKGGDPEKFKEITRAYEVLSDPNKKNVYDQCGEAGLENGLDELPTVLGLGVFGAAKATKPAKLSNRGEDVVFPLNVTLEELFFGATKKLRLTRNILCPSCAGPNASVNAHKQACKPCNGTGVKVIMRHLPSGHKQQTQTTCSECRGNGFVLVQTPCPQCGGAQTLKETKTLVVHIQQGMSHGQRICFPGLADEHPGMTSGDVVVVLQQKEHPTFIRQGNDLVFRKTVTLLGALTGLKFFLTHLDGRTLLVQSEEGSVLTPGDTKCIKGEGMPIEGDPSQRGDLYIEFNIQFPASGTMTIDDKKHLASLLPNQVTNSEEMDDEPAQDEVPQQVMLKDVDSRERARQQEAAAAHQMQLQQDNMPGNRCRTQ